MKKAQPYILLFLAAVCFYIGSYFREPLPLQHKILFATEREDGKTFDGARILVIRHDRTGAYGLVINKPGFGGPLEAGKTYTLHSTDIMPAGSMRLGGLGLAFAEGVIDEKPAWSKTYHGYAGWGRGQLDREVRRGVWTVHDFDRKLLD